MMSLGCPKTLVDSEAILGKVASQGYELVPSVADCDIALLNTCSFIEEATKESVDRILELLELKKEGAIKAVVVMGCLVQKFPQAMKDELSEVDAFVGSGEYDKIPAIVQNVIGGQKVFQMGTPGYLSTSGENRISLTPNYYRYLKVSEGCDHICSFCTIPQFRGKHRSRSIEDCVKEAQNLIAQGAKEIILTGQDTTYFGRDYTGGKYLLPELLRELDQLDGLEWLRVLYAYPSCIQTDLMETIANSKKICHYLDMPLQHASDPMLLAMRRGITKRRTTDLIHKFRSIVPDLAIRTTFIVGFPGETEKDFEELLNFIEEMRFERMGVFKYSNEESSHGATLKNHVSEKIKQERFDRAMILQQEVSKSINATCVGKTYQILIEEQDEKDKNLWLGRSYTDAPEVDGVVYVESKKALAIGSFHKVKITEAREYDLLGRI